MVLQFKAKNLWDGTKNIKWKWKNHKIRQGRKMVDPRCYHTSWRNSLIRREAQAEDQTNDGSLESTTKGNIMSRLWVPDKNLNRKYFQRNHEVIVVTTWFSSTFWQKTQQKLLCTYPTLKREPCPTHKQWTGKKKKKRWVGGRLKRST